MDVVSLCPLRARGFAWQPSFGTYAWTVVVKATFRLLPGESTLAAGQEEPGDVDQAPYKPMADVVLVGRAYAPGKRAARSWVTRLVVGELDKSIEVFCDRAFHFLDGTFVEGPRVMDMPLVWERAAGGPETGNPVGIRFDAAPDAYGRVPLPNLQPPGMFVSTRADTFAPVCFGPIAKDWPRASSRLGRLAPGWEGRPFPPRFDFGYFQVALSDQQVPVIRSNERIVLEHLHAGHDRLVTSLPGISPRAVLDRATGEREEVRLVADTLWIDTDRGICSVVWRGQVGLRHPAEAGRIAVWVEGMPLVEPAQGAVGLDDSDVAGTLTLVAPLERKSEAALPFVPGLSKLSEPERRQFVDELSRWAGRGSGDASETMFAPMARHVGNALPFEGAGEEVDVEGDMAKTLPPMPKPAFALGAFVMPSMPVNAPLPVVEEVVEEEQGKPLPAPPPMIGPIAMPEMVAQNEAAKAEEKGDEEPRTAPKPVLKAEEPKKARPEDFPLERCAALTASIARRKGEKGAILEAEELTEAEWGAIEKYWADAIKEETRRGKRGMLDRFDQAYVGRIEEERGAITVEEYARISVAGERGTVEEVIREMGIPRGGVMRVERVWVRRLLNEPALLDRLGNVKG